MLPRIVAVLEEDGYAVRTTDADDRRSSWLGDHGRRNAVFSMASAATAPSSSPHGSSGSRSEQRTALAAALDALEALTAD